MNSVRVPSIIITIIILYLWYSYFLPEKSTVEQTSLQPEQPDFIAYNLERTLFDESGQIDHQISAKKMLHYKEENTTEFDSVELILYSSNHKPHWKIKADKGVVNAEKLIILEENIIIKRLVLPSLIKIITTDYIEISTNRDKVYTDKPVVIQGDNLKMKGIGLIGYFDSQKIELIQHLSTVYEQ